jgi:putative glutamine transport system permease protein
MHNFSVLINYYDLFLRGFYHTILASVLALIGSFLLCTLIAVMRIAPYKLLNWLGTIYVEFIRNIPLLLVVYGFYLGLPSIGLTMSGFLCGTLGLIVYTASYIAEAIRAGIMSVPKGQMEAARASGLTYGQTMMNVILPQAIKIVVPPISNQFLNLVKNSSILSVVAGLDLMYFGEKVEAETFITFDTYIIVGLFYLILTIPLSYASSLLERRLAKSG